jgi:hypothetical protein
MEMRTMTNEERIEFLDETAHVPELRTQLLRGLGFWPAPRRELAPTLRAHVRAASVNAVPPPPDLNALIREGAISRAPERSTSPRPTVTRLAQGRAVPPPPDLNAAIRAAVAARADSTVSRPVVAAAPVVRRSAAHDRTAPPPPDFNAAVRAAAHQKAAR